MYICIITENVEVMRPDKMIIWIFAERKLSTISSVVNGCKITIWCQATTVCVSTWIWMGNQNCTSYRLFWHIQEPNVWKQCTAQAYMMVHPLYKSCASKTNPQFKKKTNYFPEFWPIFIWFSVEMQIFLPIQIISGNIVSA